MDIDVVSLIRKQRKARSVRRFAGQRFTDPPNIAEHQYATASLFIWLAQHMGIDVTVQGVDFVLNHDLLEVESGDLLFPVKHFRQNSEHWDAIECAIINQADNGCLRRYQDCNCATFMRTSEIWLWKFCDHLEGYITSLEELKRGNMLGDPASCVMVYQKALEKDSKDYADVFPEMNSNRAGAIVSMIEGAFGV